MSLIVKTAASMTYYVFSRGIQVTRDTERSDSDSEFKKLEIFQLETEDLVNVTFTIILYIFIFKM